MGGSDRGHVTSGTAADDGQLDALQTTLLVWQTPVANLLGDAIGLSIRSFESSEVEDRLLILLTDGNDTASRMTPINAAEIAVQNGIQIHTIGIGDEQAQGEDRVDFSTLAAIAERTGGTFSNADDEQSLTGIYAAIDAMTSADVRTQTWRPRTSLVYWPAAATLLLMVFGYLVFLALRGVRTGS